MPASIGLAGCRSGCATTKKESEGSVKQDDGYIRVVEQFPMLLQLNAAKLEDLKLIISMAYNVGLGDGREEALSVLGAVMTGVKMKDG